MPPSCPSRWALPSCGRVTRGQAPPSCATRATVSGPARGALQQQWCQSPRHAQLSVTPWTVALQAPLSMAFSRQESWSWWPCPPPGDLPDPGTGPRLSRLPHWRADSLPLAPPGGNSGHYCYHPHFTDRKTEAQRGFSFLICDLGRLGATCNQEGSACQIHSSPGS